jgi:hypothetical protein
MRLKKFFEAKAFLMTVALALFACGFTACSSDDDGDGDGGGSGPGTPTLEAPAFESVSAKYEIEGDGSIKSIELTESGNYVIITDEYQSSYNDSYFAHTRAGGTSGVIFGKFIKISDTEFILEGFGSIVIEGNTNSAFSLQISETGKEPYEVGAEKIEAESSDIMTKALCRTWDIDKVSMTLYVFGRKMYDRTLPASQYTELWEGLIAKIKEIESEYEDEEDEEYYEEDDEYDEMIPKFNPEQIIFTKAGSYMTTYEDDQLAISTWTWTNSNQGVFRYSHNYDYIYDPEYSNECNISFDGKSMTLFEVNAHEYDEDEDMEVLKVTSRYFCSEAE